MKFILAFLLTILFLTSAFSQNNKYGLFVGVGKYPNSSNLTSLISSGNDALQMCLAFSPTCGKDYKSKLIINAEATRRAIIENILLFQKIAKAGDTFTLYYSGHGSLFPDRLSEELDEKLGFKVILKNGVLTPSAKAEKFDSALVPYDANENTDGKIWKNLILDDELYRLFGGFASKGVKIIFISDSCYSGGQGKGGDFVNKQTSDFFTKFGAPKFSDWKDAIGIKSESDLNIRQLQQKEFRPDSSLENMYILVASSSETEPSYSKNPYNTNLSIFTYHFLNTLQQYKNEKKAFTFETIKNEVFQKVYADAKQSPQVNTEFYKMTLDLSVF